ncbi:MAG: hypothetical protein VB108_02015 [Anaerolineaceae bacterium]|nr:hypothetical protein [Anaerolineaceae bacterium]
MPNKLGFLRSGRQTRQAVNKLRAKQEESELRYWLTFFAYNHNDKSFSNRIYLVYLVIFLSVMLLLWLIYLAQGFSNILSAFPPFSPQSVAFRMNIVVLLLWAIWTAWKSLSRSPLKFTEDDASILCLQPVEPSHLSMRWFWMPWLRSLIPCLLFLCLISFGMAELNIPRTEISKNVFIYLAYGLRIMILALPFHFSMSLLAWSAGLFAMRNRKNRLRILPAFFLLGGWMSLLVLCFVPSGEKFLGVLFGILNQPAPISRFAWMGLALVVAALALVFRLIARKTSISTAAWETAQENTLSEFQRYGFSGLAGSIRTKKRLGVQRRSEVNSCKEGVWSLCVKGWLQFRRSFTWTRLWSILRIAGFWLGIVLAPTIWLKLLSLAAWVYNMREFALRPLREDLSQRYILSLMPFSLFEIALANMIVPYFVLLITLGMAHVSAAFLIGHSAWNLLLVLPGVLASSLMVFASVLFAKAEPNSLINGSVPDPVLPSLIMGFAAAVPPFLVMNSGSGFQAILLAFIAHLIVIFLAFLTLRWQAKNLNLRR